MENGKEIDTLTTEEELIQIAKETIEYYDTEISLEKQEELYKELPNKTNTINKNDKF